MKIINLMPHGPQYDVYWDPSRLLTEWELPDSRRTSNGNDNREWAAQLGHWVVAQRPDWTWEVWQPDTRAQRIYTHEFDDGVVHRLIPAEERSQGILRRREPELQSTCMLKRCAELDPPYVLVLHGLGAPLWQDVLDHFRDQPHIPIYLVGHGSAAGLKQRLLSCHQPLSVVQILTEHITIRRAYVRLNGISAPDNVSVSASQEIYPGRVDRLAMGCDFGFWMPVPDRATKDSIRADIGVPPHQTLFLSVGRLQPTKGTDRLLRAFRQLDDRRDFKLLVVGQGEQRYKRYLRSLAGPLLSDGRVVFHPHVTGQALRRLYWAADAFVGASWSEGGPVTIMEALGCGLPIVSTPVGRANEVMLAHGAGAVLPVQDCTRWPVSLRSILDAGPPRPLDRALARREFDWPNIAAMFIANLAEVIDQHVQNWPIWAQPEVVDAARP